MSCLAQFPKKKKEKHKFHKYCVKVPKAKKKNGNFQQYECGILNFTTNMSHKQVALSLMMQWSNFRASPLKHAHRCKH